MHRAFPRSSSTRTRYHDERTRVVTGLRMLQPGDGPITVQPIHDVPEQANVAVPLLPLRDVVMFVLGHACAWARYPQGRPSPSCRLSRSYPTTD